MSKIKTGLASFGMSGQVFHAPFINIHPAFELTAITERSKNLSRRLYPGSQLVRSFDELISYQDTELIVVNTPDATHYEYARKALEAGKNVIVEKPFTMTTGQGKELISLARRKGLMLGVYQNRRWDADFLTVREIIDNNKLGRIVEFESTFARFRNYIQPGTWKETQGGMTYNLGSHLIDQAVCLFGIPQAVFADIAILRDGGIVDDYFAIHLLGCSENPGVRITLKASYLMREPEPRFVLHGVNGSFVKHGVDPQEALLKEGAVPGAGDWGIETQDEWGTINTDVDGIRVYGKYKSLKGDYYGFYESVYQHLRHNKPLPTDAVNILPVIQIIEAALESGKSRSVVKLQAIY